MTSLSKEELIFMAKVCEQAEKYKDMLSYAKKLILQIPDEGPNIEERNLLSVAYKNLIGDKRTSWRAISSIEQKELLKGYPHAHLIVQKRKIIEEELKEICYDALDFVENNLLKSSHTAHSRIFFTRMKGDYYRYLVECLHGDEKSDTMDQCYETYDEVMEIAETELKATDPTRLSLALNFSVNWYEFLGNRAKGREIGMKAFNDALEELEELDDENYREATMLMQMLRDNETRWMVEEKPEQAEQSN